MINIFQKTSTLQVNPFMQISITGLCKGLQFSKKKIDYSNLHIKMLIMNSDILSAFIDKAIKQFHSDSTKITLQSF